MVSAFDRKGAPPDHGGVGLGPWTFRVNSVDSFEGSYSKFQEIFILAFND